MSALIGVNFGVSQVVLWVVGSFCGVTSNVSMSAGVFCVRLGSEELWSFGCTDASGDGFVGVLNGVLRGVSLGVFKPNLLSRN